MATDSTLFANFVRQAGGYLTASGLGGKVSQSIAARDLDQLAGYLRQGLEPNNSFGRISYVQAAMLSHLLDGAAREPDEVQQRSRSLCFLLLNAGARLDHCPQDAGDHPSALANPLAWTACDFGRNTLIAASAAALHRNALPPRLTLSSLFLPLGTASGEGAAAVVSRAFSQVMDVQKSVAQRLETPQTEAEKFVATNLNPEDRAFWREAAATAQAPQILTF